MELGHAVVSLGLQHWNESSQIRSASQRGSVLSISSCQWAHVVLAARGGVLGNHSALLSGSDLQGQRFAPPWLGMGLGVGRGERLKLLKNLLFQTKVAL